jgi:uncharacterized protein (TIGR03000 family)
MTAARLSVLYAAALVGVAWTLVGNTAAQTVGGRPGSNGVYVGGYSGGYHSGDNGVYVGGYSGGYHTGYGGVYVGGYADGRLHPMHPEPEPTEFRGYTSEFYPNLEITGPEARYEAVVGVRVPPGADVWFDGERTSQTGAVRIYVSPRLVPGARCAYQVRARWTERGHTFDETRKIPIHAGDRLRVDFLRPPMPLVSD